MSTATDLAELEAATAEAELTAEETDLVNLAVADGATVPEAIAAALALREVEAASASATEDALAAANGEPSDAQLRKLDKEVERHLKAVHTTMGAHVAGFVACEACGGVGLVPPNAPKTNPLFKACETCAGYGEVLTGSRRGGQESRDCPDCRGRGYLELLSEQGAPLAPPSIGPTPEGQPPASPPPMPVLSAVENGQEGARYGVPAWMGDPNLNT